MTNQPDSTLSLDEVVVRFRDAEDLLVSAGKQLNALGEAQTVNQKAATSLQEAAGAIDRLAQDASGAVAELAAAQADARRVLEAGSALIDGTDLREVQRAIAELQSAVLERFAAAAEDARAAAASTEKLKAEQDAALHSRFDSLERQFQQLLTDHAESRAVLDEVRTAVERRRRRFLFF